MMSSTSLSRSGCRAWSLMLSSIVSTIWLGCSTPYPTIVCPEVRKPLQSQLHQEMDPLPALRSLPESKLSPADLETLSLPTAP